MKKKVNLIFCIYQQSRYQRLQKLTLLTGSLFQIAVLTGHSSEFIWLLEWHRGKFGRINLEMIYPFLNAFGLMMLAVTGILLWFRTRKRSSM